MAVYAYLRVSTDKQDGINQKRGVDALAVARGLTIDEYIDDEGKSGTLEPEKRVRAIAAQEGIHFYHIGGAPKQ